MKRVLVVDDEEDMLWMLQRNLNKGMEDVEILAAKSAEEALAILSDRPANLVITDINMPGMNGLDLLIEINNRFPATGVIIMTAYPSNAYENKAMMSGSLRFIEKPFDINDVRTIVKEALKVNEGFQGTVDGVDLIDIVQFNSLSRATAALKVTTGDREGMIFFKDGAVLHAMCGQETGESAFFTILGFNGGSLQNIRGVQPPIVSIHKSIEGLLFEAAVNNDEKSAAENGSADDAPSSDAVAHRSDDQQPATATLEELITNIDLDTAGDAKPPARNDADSREDRPTTSPEEFEMTEIQSILAEFTNIEGVHTACLIGRDGFLLDSLARPGIDAEMIAAIASSGFGSAESMGSQLGQGELRITLFEFENGPVLFAPVGKDAILVIVADLDTNLGWIRISIKKNSKKIQAAASL
ncbi:response regulator [Desulfopila sp. IMCC35006]|uniref:response regulator n=1 Tax=Desulfopila sp. IMCC35006 TaxID=2569542 RepID=UPI0010AD4E01|nr:response regulator [Desulfopila sp. IMCC35006]TKB26915.1 response regulator [Desulfopila sp. IMCC35006]